MCWWRRQQARRPRAVRSLPAAEKKRLLVARRTYRRLRLSVTAPLQKYGAREAPPCAALASRWRYFASTPYDMFSPAIVDVVVDMRRQEEVPARKMAQRRHAECIDMLSHDI